MICIKKRYEVIYYLYDDLSYSLSIKKEKVLFRTNLLWLARFYFRDRVTIFRDFVKGYHVEVFVYDCVEHMVITSCVYFIKN